jgi:hypothetical protein
MKAKRPPPAGCPAKVRFGDLPHGNVTNLCQIKHIADFSFGHSDNNLQNFFFSYDGNRNNNWENKMLRYVSFNFIVKCLIDRHSFNCRLYIWRFGCPRCTQHKYHDEALEAKVKYRVRSPKVIWPLCAQLYWDPAPLPHPPHLGSYTIAQIDDISLWHPD